MDILPLHGRATGAAGRRHGSAPRHAADTALQR